MHRHNSRTRVHDPKPSGSRFGAVLRDQRHPIATPDPVRSKHTRDLMCHPMQRGKAYLTPLLRTLPKIDNRTSFRRPQRRLTQNLTYLQTHTKVYLRHRRVRKLIAIRAGAIEGDHRTRRLDSLQTAL
jgi:hypothetical protein